jgi:hypothetical protein
MPRRVFGQGDPRGAAFRRIHERFLELALRSARRVPRIPLRRVDRGGFSSLLARPGGRNACDRWWSRAFDRLDQTGL